MKLIAIAALLAAALAGSALAGHVVTPPGYVLSETPVQGFWANGFDFAPTAGNFFVYDSKLYETTAGGTVVRTLYTVPADCYGSFARYDASANRLYFGENGAGVGTTSGAIKYIELDDPASTHCLVANLPGNYDFALRVPGQALAVAGPDIYHVDLTSGAAKKIASAGGVSGALDVDAAGNLYYGTAEAFAGAGQAIVKWTAAQVDAAIASDLVLTVADGTKLLDDISSVGGLAVDSTGLYFTVNMTSTGGVLARVMRYNGLDAGGTLRQFAVAPNGYEWFSNIRADEATGTLSINAGAAISTLTPIPEPGSMVALALGLSALIIRRRR